MITTEERDALAEAINYHPSLEGSRLERIAVIRFGQYGQYQKSFVSQKNARAFEEFLESHSLEFSREDHDFSNYGEIR